MSTALKVPGKHVSSFSWLLSRFIILIEHNNISVLEAQYLSGEHIDCLYSLPWEQSLKSMLRKNSGLCYILKVLQICEYFAPFTYTRIALIRNYYHQIGLETWVPDNRALLTAHNPRWLHTCKQSRN